MEHCISTRTINVLLLTIMSGVQPFQFDPTYPPGEELIHITLKKRRKLLHLQELTKRFNINL